MLHIADFDLKMPDVYMNGIPMIITILFALALVTLWAARALPHCDGFSRYREPFWRKLPRAILLTIAVAALFVSGIPKRALADPLPPGPYQNHTQPLHFGEGCVDLKMQGSTLTAYCANLPLGRLSASTLDDANACVAEGHQIDNINGVLRCVISPGVTAGGEDGDSSHQYVGNIVSMLPTQKTPTGTRRWFIIDNPRVDVPSSDLKNITYQPGDWITLWAGGCAQTGGYHLTWKSYVDPLGSYGETLYAGTVGLPGVTQSPKGFPEERIGKYISNNTMNNTVKPQPRSYHVNLHLPSDVLAQGLFLRLGYQDDNYTDNGYWNHDDGDGNPPQCAGIGPAWVKIAIFTLTAQASSSNGVSWRPAFKPFDLTWNQNAAGDDNGFPINPVWHQQVVSPSPGASHDLQSSCGWSTCSTPDFQICRGAFANSTTVNDTALADICTTNEPTVDLFTGVGRGWFDYCDGLSALLDGHLNWGFATYDGTLQWGDYNAPPGDSDYTLHVSRDDLGLTTARGQPGVMIEADAQRSFDLFAFPWWKAFHDDSDDAKHSAIDVKRVIVTGQVGVDGVHSGYVEIHPVLSMAIRTSVKPTADGVDETWDYFIVNQGDEGSCSEYTYSWGPGPVSIQLPWPPEATHGQVVWHPGELWSTQADKQFQGPSFETDSSWTYVKFQIPPAPSEQFPPFGYLAGADGEVVIHYTIVGGAKPVPHRPMRPAPIAETHEDNWVPVEGSIRDARTRQAFDVDLRKATSQVEPAVYRKTIVLNIPLVTHHAVPDPSRRGILTKPQRSPNLVRAREELQLRALFTKYQRALPGTLQIPP